MRKKRIVSKVCVFVGEREVEYRRRQCGQLKSFWGTKIFGSFFFFFGMFSFFFLCQKKISKLESRWSSFVKGR